MLTCSRSGNRLTVCLGGEIDHCASENMKEEIEKILSDPMITELHLDFSHVSFIDSSGIGMVIGRYKTMKARKGRITAGGIGPELEKVYRLAGLHRIIPLSEEGKIVGR